jgi:2-oxoisovalerate dehydrogenase E1 component
MHFDRRDLSDEKLLDLYRSLLLPRLIEEKMLLLLRQGKISKWFSGIGQEAISVGATLALDDDEWIFPLHRNLGVFTSRKMSLNKLAKQWLGHTDGYSKGRERSFHFGSREHYICGMISHLGPQLAIANGVSLSHKLKSENKVAIAFTGEGGTSEGDFHEALNIASVWDLPVIFLIENNGYALSTPVDEQYRCDSLIDRARGYGMDGVKIDGNNILSVYDTIKGVKEYCLKKHKPYLVECTTFRMRGHEEASGTKYIPKYLFEIWEKKDPVARFKKFLEQEQIINDETDLQLNSEFHNYIEGELAEAFAHELVVADSRNELHDIYAPRNSYSFSNIKVARENDAELRYVDAVREGLLQSMIAHDDLILMGQDIAEYGGAFKITEGFCEQFGKERVRNTPLCESGIIGTALGLSLCGQKSVVEMQFADFVTSGFTQIVNNLAKIYYRWGQEADVVIRMPTGGGLGAGPFHSQSNEAWFAHTPGLKVVYPATAYDAKGLMIASINDPNPVMFFEHKALYRSISDEVPAGYYEVEIGKANLVEEGEDVSIITYGSGVHWALEYGKENQQISLDILDLRTLLPLDYEAIRASVRRTGKVLVLHEDTLTGGIGGEIAAWIGEHCFDHLDAPVMRCASLDTPVPFSTVLENDFLARSRVDEYIQRLVEY